MEVNDSAPLNDEPFFGSDRRLRVAVVGGGAAGVTTSWILSRRHDVTLFEKNGYVGGHVNTVTIPSGPDAGTPVDTGFIVKNNRTYPTFNRLLEQLEVGVRDSDMSFGFRCEATGREYATTHPLNLFAKKRLLFSPSHWSMIREIIRFNREATAAIERGVPADRTLKSFLDEGRYGRPFRDFYLVPMAAAIWSSRPAEILEFPASTFLTFYRNHGLLTAFDQPIWQTVIGGSRSYVDAFLKKFSGRVVTSAPIRKVIRTLEHVTVERRNGERETFDSVVFASHADETLAMLDEPTADERALLGAWRYEKNRVVLHCDESLMPRRRRAWASWNYCRESSATDAASQDDRPVSVTYHMNRLQGLKTERQYLVTLNRRGPIDSKKVLFEVEYAHPQFNSASVSTQPELGRLQGRKRTYFCGSYHGYGFHEDAVKSGVAVAKRFGLDL
jgi:predicted NAD/FAD-binding protein